MAHMEVIANPEPSTINCVVSLQKPSLRTPESFSDPRTCLGVYGFPCSERGHLHQAVVSHPTTLASRD